MIKIRIKATIDIEVPLNYAGDATLDTIKQGVRQAVQSKVEDLFVGQTDLTLAPPLELVVMQLEDTL